MFVTERWLGGLLTNFQTAKKQIRRLKDLEAGSEEGGDFGNYTKKEQLMMTRQQREAREEPLGHQEHGPRCRACMFVDRRQKEKIAVTEANKLGIPIVAIVDTNADPDLITVPIAGNDDAIRSVELITQTIANAIGEARREAPVHEESRMKRALRRTAPTAAASPRTMAIASAEARRAAAGRSRKRSPRA